MNQKRVQNIIEKDKKKKRWKRIIGFLSIVVVFCTAYSLILPALTMEVESKVLDCSYNVHTHTPSCYDEDNNLICGYADYVIHEHILDCYDENGNLVCPLPEIKEHTHDESCYDQDGNLICDKEEIIEHEHASDCYDENNNLICEQLEVKKHDHGEGCFKTVVTQVPIFQSDKTEETSNNVENENTLSGEELNRIDEIIKLIDELPTSEEIDNTLNEYDNDEDTENYDAYYLEVQQQAQSVWVQYEDLSEEMKQQLTNADKLLELSWLWESIPLTVTNEVTVYSVNHINWNPANPVIVYGGSVEEKTGESNLAYWTAIVVKEDESNNLYVETIDTTTNPKGGYVAENGKGFVLLLNNISINAEEGDRVTVTFDFKNVQGYKNDGYGTVTFHNASEGEQKEQKNNGLTPIQSADTKDLIEVNLYDYGNNINEKYNSNNNFPGFQNPGGTTSIGTSLSKYSYNFGDNITSDLKAGKADITKRGGLINEPNSSYDGTNYGTANIPISGAMSSTLGTDGYPALSNGTSLSYLFTNNTYATKKNTDNINGLFQYNSSTGAYTFNSRENHAQFNASDNTFTLYSQLISSNFMMYPFGNFLPFNDINTQCAQASTIDGDYLESIAASARYKSNQNQDDLSSDYNTLSNALTDFVNRMDELHPEGWEAKDCVNGYFSANKLSKIFTNEELSNIYSIDYDEATDFYFGMEMKMNFMQPKGGLTGSDGQQPMKFYFTGDDDVWVYVDGKLFLDLSGIHRHVGGEIDFVNGEVKYYALDPSTGDVSYEPFKIVTFEDILGSKNELNGEGTFKDYSTHSFNFYYMERGSGSGVCRMNFNFPLLKQNSISVTKELSTDNTEIDALGNPDFKFQVLKADENGNKTNNLFIGKDIQYNIYDSKTNTQVGTGETDANGVFKIKAGQRAEFTGINENAGKYYVRELLDSSIFDQYGKITVDGTSQTTNYDVTVGNDTFKGRDSNVKDMSDGSTVFHFDNKVTTNKLGSLKIEKVLNSFNNSNSSSSFDFEVKLDNQLLPVGTKYKVGNEDKTVTTEGIITIPAGQAATINNILAGSMFTVKETDNSSSGYSVSYSGNDITTTDDSASGVIKVGTTVAVTVTNTEKGATVQIPIHKTITNPDANDHEFTFNLEQVNEDGSTIESPLTQRLTLTVNNVADGHFTLTYLDKGFNELPQTFWYKITEQANTNNGQHVDFDETVYIVGITVSKDEQGTLQASITSLAKLAKDGNKIDSIRTLEFSNTLLEDLTITKQVNGLDKTTQKFYFELTLNNGEQPITGEYQAIISSKSDPKKITFNEEGKASFELLKDQSITIKDLPKGVSWTLTETNPDGFIVSYEVGNDTTKGNTSQGSVDGNNVTCINKASYSLPGTGGSGTTLFTIGGVLLISTALILLYTKNKRRKEENTSC